MKSSSGCFFGVIIFFASIMFLGAITTILSVASIGGKAGTIMTAIFTLVFVVMFFLFYRFLFQPFLNVRRLQKTGLSGKARIISVKGIGVTVNKNPMVKLEVEITNSLGQRYTTFCRTLVTRLNPGLYTPGNEIPVKIDPKNENNVVVDLSTFVSNGGSATSTTNTTQPDELKAELEQLELTNTPIEISGRQAKAIIKRNTVLVVNAIENKSLVELEVEVVPEILPPFTAFIKDVFPESEFQAFQPGKEIAIKYDFYDNSKAVIDKL